LKHRVRLSSEARSDVVDGMIEDVEFGLCESVACNAQHIVSLHLPSVGELLPSRAVIMSEMIRILDVGALRLAASHKSNRPL